MKLETPRIDSRTSSPKPLHASGLARASGACSAAGPLDPKQLAQLEELDDVIFAALKGDPTALDRSAPLYRRVRKKASSVALDESREQYLRMANSVFHRYRDQPEAMLSQTFAAMEILTLLAE